MAVIHSRLPYENSVIRITEGKEVRLNLRYGFMQVHLSELKDPLTMVFIKGFSDKPMMLLTSLKIGSKEKDLWFIISAYMKRWSLRNRYVLSNKHMIWKISGS